MHLGNGAITPECVVFSCTAATLGLGTAFYSARQAGLSRAIAARAVTVGMFTLAAQAINVPVLPFASGHLVGGVLAAVLLGPSVGALVMASVIAIQAVALGDGGVTALGANVINMALLPAGLVALAARWAPSDDRGPARGRIPLLACLAMAAVVLASGLIVGEVSIGRTSVQMANLSGFALRMLAYHVWIGAGEALLTAAVLWAIGRRSQPATTAWREPAVLAAVMVALLAAVAIIPLASDLPDGFQAAAQQSHMNWSK